MVEVEDNSRPIRRRRQGSSESVVGAATADFTTTADFTSSVPMDIDLAVGGIGVVDADLLDSYHIDGEFGFDGENAGGGGEGESSANFDQSDFDAF